MAVLTAPEARVLYTTRFPLMGGEALIRFADDRGPARAERAARAAVAEARRIEAKYSRYRAQSVVSEINREAGRGPVVIDAETEHLIQSALELWRATGGRFDPTVGALRRVWDFKAARVPSAAEVAALLPLVEARAVELRHGTVALGRPGMELDLGGVGKEYAADRVAERLLEEGVASAVINFLGDVRTLGRRGDGRPWRVGVQDPRDRGRCRLVVRVGAEAGVATSGDYERGFIEDGVRYHHLLDATTGWPARGLASVTVVAPTAFDAGRLATAAFLLGPTAGLDLLEGATGVEAAMITEAGDLLATSGLGAIADLAG
ncbi:FAD:protein FMN transferase [Geothrix rubra]|uniref:FAD:protein FMN transferase n=1 Tax=Geothrix rubra TaxID=2927977 RepID=A0ABQ5Q8U0_9BACT|nr:FAD:protein FMN transferase [Geothrix rubra]GLH71242.1 FAD:protein FMN transferase [Geothrix rubra]